jgi:hypothetical protein
MQEIVKKVKISSIKPSQNNSLGNQRLSQQKCRRHPLLVYSIAQNHVCYDNVKLSQQDFFQRYIIKVTME